MDNGDTKLHDNDFYLLKGEIEKVDIRLEGLVRLTEKEDIHLRELLESNIANLDKSTSLAQAQIREHQVASNNLQRKMDDMSKELISRDEYAIRHEPLEKRVSNLELAGAKLEGKADQSYVDRQRDIALLEARQAVEVADKGRRLGWIAMAVTVFLGFASIAVSIYIATGR